MSNSDNHYAPPQSTVGDRQPSTKPSVRLVRLVAVFMAAMGLYWLYGGFSASPQSYNSIMLSIVPFAAAFGLWLKQSWSQYPVHLLSVLAIGLWCWQMWFAIQQNTFPYPTVSATVIGVAISLLPLIAVVGSSAIAFRYFRVKS